MIWLNVLHMSPIWTLVVLAMSSLEYLMPELSRPGIAFSITVTEEFRRSEAHSKIVRRYRRGIALSALAGLFVAMGGVAQLDGWSGPGAFTIQYVIFLVSFAMARSATAKYRVAPDPVREAEFTRREPPIMLALLVIAPLIAMCAALAWTYANWQLIPDPYPVHWGLNGQPDLWVQRTPLHVYGMLGLLAGVAAVLAFFGYGFLFWVRRPDGTQERSWYRLPAGWIAIVLGAEYFVAASAMLPLGMDVHPVELILLSLLAASSLCLIVIGPIGSRAPSRTNDYTPDGAWKLGIFYYNPEDAALFVEKRFGLGWTVNFGQVRAWILLGLAVAPLGLGFAFVMSLTT
jgi:uncharacterized membrane protein